MLRSRYIRSFLVSTLSILIGFGLVLIFLPRLGLSQETEDFWGTIVAFVISIPIYSVVQLILRKLIGPPEI